MYGGKGKMQIIGKICPSDFRLGDDVCTGRRYCNQGKDKTAGAEKLILFYVFGIAEIIASGKRYLRYDNTDTCKNVCKLTGCSGSGGCG